MQRVRPLVHFFVAALLAILPTLAAPDVYDYDAAGRVSRIIAPDGTVTRYDYDALGNLRSVAPDTAALPPVITDVTPMSVFADTTTDIAIHGLNLADATVLAPSHLFIISDRVATSDLLTFALHTDAQAPLEPQTFRVQNPDGEANFTLEVALTAPTLGVRPLPLALPEDGSLRQFLVRISRPESTDRTVALSVSDPAIAELQAETVLIPAGETEVVVGVRGLSGGVTRLTLASAGLEAVSVSIYVTAEYGSVSATYADLVGIQVGTSGSDPTELQRDARSARVGVVRGPVIAGLTPPALGVGALTAPLTIAGSGLQSVDGVLIDPADGVTLSEITSLDDGTGVLVSVSIAEDAPLGPRRVILTGADQPYPAAAPGADRLSIVASHPTIDSLSPILDLRGTTAATLTIRGRDLDDATDVALAPADGIVLGNDLNVSADGTRLTLRYSIAADAPLGERLVRAITPAGASTEVLSAHNRFTVIETVLGTRTPLAAPLLGVQVGSNGSASPVDVQAVASPLGVTVGASLSALSPASGSVGANVDLTLSGQGLSAVSELRFEPADGITLAGLVLDPLGEAVLAQLEIAADAPQTPRRVRVFADAREISFASPAVSRFLVTALAPRLQAVHPNTLQIGAGVQSITLYGANLERATQVLATPPHGLVMGAPSVSADGTRLDVLIEAAAGASLGARVLTVTTPAGQTAGTADVTNTLMLYEEALAQPTPVTAPLVGIQVGDATPGGERIIDALSAPLLGLAVGTGITPAPDVAALVPAPLLGVTVGPFATVVEAPPLLLGDTHTLTITGGFLDRVDAVGAYPGWDLAAGTPVANAEGTRLIVNLTLPLDAAPEPRSLRLAAGSTPIDFAAPQAALVELASGVPEIISIQPIVGEPGEVIALVVRGRHLQGTTRVLATPANGLRFDTALTVNAAGTEVRTRVHLAEDAALGARTLRVETPGGLSAANPSAANTFTLY